MWLTWTIAMNMWWLREHAPDPFAMDDDDTVVPLQTVPPAEPKALVA